MLGFEASKEFQTILIGQTWDYNKDCINFDPSLETKPMLRRFCYKKYVQERKMAARTELESKLRLRSRRFGGDADRIAT